MKKITNNLYFIYAGLIACIIFIFILIIMSSSPSPSPTPYPTPSSTTFPIELPTTSSIPTEYENPTDDPNYQGDAPPPTPEEAATAMVEINGIDNLSQKGWSDDEIAFIENQLTTQIAARNPGYDYYSLVLVLPDFFYQIVDEGFKIKIGFIPIIPSTPENPNAEIKDQIPSISFFATLQRVNSTIKVTVTDPEVIYL
jgi:hypothetical protein